MIKFEKPDYKITEYQENNHYAKFEIEPLERGFGTTLGNALRRTMLSSLPGDAICSVKIDGVAHEFQKIDGVIEDVTAIVLNLKSVVIKNHSDDYSAILRIHREGPGEVLADDIETDADIEILNPEQLICTLAEGGSINMEMTISNGRGYARAEENKVLYGDDDNIKQTFTYLVEFINNYFNRYDLTINISKISVRNNCKLMFSIIVNYKNTKLDFIERDNKCIIETNAWEYELYNRLVELQKGTYEVKKDNSSLIFNFALFQKIKDNNEVVEEEVIKYNNYSGKKILIALDNHLDINKFTELLVNYNVDISTSSSIEELTELLRSDKTFDIVFLSNTISGIENYNITTSEERKRTMTKLSLIAGYKLQIIMVTFEDYKDSDTEYIKMPISKVKLDDIMVKYLSEK